MLSAVRMARLAARLRMMVMDLRMAAMAPLTERAVLPVNNIIIAKQKIRLKAGFFYEKKLSSEISSRAAISVAGFVAFIAIKSAESTVFSLSRFER
jgi:hypothetical protein